MQKYQTPCICRFSPSSLQIRSKKIFYTPSSHILDKLRMGTQIRNIREKRRFNVGRCNVRGLTEDTKEEQLVRDVNQYGIDVSALQEIKIENAGVHRANGRMIITFDSKNKHYGIGFVVH